MSFPSKQLLQDIPRDMSAPTLLSSAGHFTHFYNINIKCFIMLFLFYIINIFDIIYIYVFDV